MSSQTLYSAFTTSNCRQLASNYVVEFENRKELCVLSMCESTTTPDSIVVCDCDNSRILEYSIHPHAMNAPRPRVVVQFSLTEDTPEFSSPSGIVPCGDGTHDYIVVFNSLRLSCAHRVSRISGDDGREKWTAGSFGNENSNFNNPWHVAMLPGGHAVVADHANHRLQVLDIATGAFVKQLG